MGKRILAYLAVFLITLYYFFLYEDKIMAVMLIVEAVYFFLGIINVKYLRKKMNVTMGEVISVAEKNHDIPVRMHVCNDSWIPMAHFQAVLVIENLFTGDKVKQKIEGKIKSHSEKDFITVIRAKECGNIKITLERYFIFDLFFIFRDKIKIREIRHVRILPECRVIPIEVSRRTRDFISDADEYSSNESGDDPSEIYQIRQYNENDSVHDIHWKLSAKADELLVKEHSKPLGCVVLIWLNLKAENCKSGKSKKNVFTKPYRKGKKDNRRIPVNILEVAASLSLSLLEEKCIHMVAWYEPENKEIRKKRIDSEEQIYELLERLLFVKTYQDEEEVRSLYEDTFRGVHFSTIVEFRTDGEILVGEESIKIPIEAKQLKWGEIYFSV